MNIHIPGLAALLLIGAVALPLPANGQCTKAPILIVTSSYSLNNTVGTLLRSVGYSSLEHASTLDEAQARLQVVRRVGLVIADYPMELKSGMQFFQWVRAESRLAYTPFILLPMNDDPRIFDQIREAHVNARVLAKPFRLEMLMPHVQALTCH